MFRYHTFDKPSLEGNTAECDLVNSSMYIFSNPQLPRSGSAAFRNAKLVQENCSLRCRRVLSWFIWSFQLPGKLLQSKGTKDATREAKLLFQRALDIHTAKQGVYHTDTKTIRRALTSLETVDLGARFSGKGTAKDRELLALDGLRSRPFTKTSRNLDFRQASTS